MMSRSARPQVTHCTARLFANLPISLGLLVKCSTGSSAKGSWMLCRMFSHWSAPSARVGLASEGGRTDGLIAVTTARTVIRSEDLIHTHTPHVNPCAYTCINTFNQRRRMSLCAERMPHPDPPAWPAMTATITAGTRATERVMARRIHGGHLISRKPVEQALAWEWSEWDGWLQCEQPTFHHELSCENAGHRAGLKDSMQWFHSPPDQHRNPIA